MMEVWQVYNSEDSWYPFVLPFVFWVATLVYYDVYLPRVTPSSKEERVPWADQNHIHNLHNCGALIFSWIALYYDDDMVLRERTAIFFSASYFIVELFDSAIHFNWEMTAHAVFVLILGYANYSQEICRELRMNSRATQMELSTPFLFWSRRTRQPIPFLSFALVFTLCRVVWIPIGILRPIFISQRLPWHHWILCCVYGFYGLTLFWYYKILRIIVRKVVSKESMEDEDRYGNAVEKQDATKKD